MAITYPVDVANTRWSVLEQSSGEIVARNKLWPRADGMAIEGADPDYVYLLQLPRTPPDYDSRLYSLSGQEVVDADANTLGYDWAVIAKPSDDRIMAAENREAEQLEAIVGQVAREVIETRLVLGAVLNYALKNQVFPAKVQTRIDDYIVKALKVWQNRDVLKAKIDAITAGQTPDLDAGWIE